jgi:hypothetical protein
MQCEIFNKPIYRCYARAIFLVALFVFTCQATVIHADLHITAYPQLRTVVTVGGDFTLSIGVTGQEPLQFVWKHNGRPIAGADGRELNRSAVSMRDGGYYIVEVSNGSGGFVRAFAFVLIQPFIPELYVWGSNTTMQTTIPANMGDVVAISAGRSHALALNSQGRVFAWGNNHAGQINAPSGTSGYVAVSAGDSHSLALTAAGTVHSWGNLRWVDTELRNVVAIAAGYDYSLALKADGTVVEWDKSRYNSTNGVTELHDIVAIATGANTGGAILPWSKLAIALRAEGTVVVRIFDSWSEEYVPEGLQDVVAVAAGGRHFLAQKRDGSMIAWTVGDEYWHAYADEYGIVRVPDGLTDAVYFAAGNNYTLVVRENGMVVSWGYGESTTHIIPKDLGEVVSVAAGWHFALALRDLGMLPAAVIDTPGGVWPVGGEVILQASIAGGSPQLQWKKNGVPIPGANGRSLHIVNASEADSGLYSIVVTAVGGTVESEPAQIWVKPAPTIVTAPVPRTVICEGQPFSLHVDASGNGPLHYLWKHNGRVVQHNAPYAKAAASYQDAGYYVAEVTDADGLVTRAIAFVIVAPWTSRVVNWTAEDLITEDLEDVVADDYVGWFLHRDGRLTGRHAGEPTIMYQGPDYIFDAVDVVPITGDTIAVLRADGQTVVWNHFEDRQYPVPPAVSDVVALASGPFLVA